MTELTHNFGLSWKDLNNESSGLLRRMEELAQELPPEARRDKLMAHFERRLEANDDLKKVALNNISTSADVQNNILDSGFALPKRLGDYMNSKIPLFNKDMTVG